MTSALTTDLSDFVIAEGHRDNFEITLCADRGEPHPVRDSMLERLRTAGTNLTIIAVGGDGPHHRAGSDRPLEGSLQVLDLFLTECEDWPKFRVVRDSTDLPSAGDDDVLRLVLEIEGGRPFQSDYSSGLNEGQKLCLLRTFFRLGIRSIHLTHQGRNELGDGLNELGSGGKLSRFGVSVIKEAARLGILVSLSHLTPECYFHALDVAEGPMLATHSNVAALTPHPRNLTDTQMRALAAGGGVMGIHGVASFLDRRKPMHESFVDHIVYAADLIGAEHVGFGIFGSDLAYVEVFPNTRDSMFVSPEYPDGVTYAQQAEIMVAGLESRGMSQDEIALILGGNYLRVMRDVLPSEVPTRASVSV